jgi:hypothetical protein
MVLVLVEGSGERVWFEVEVDDFAWGCCCCCWLRGTGGTTLHWGEGRRGAGEVDDFGGPGVAEGAIGRHGGMRRR